MCVARAMAVLGGAVIHVVLMRTQPKVGRVHARWIVAGVANEHALGDRTVVEFVGGAMSQTQTAILKREATIPRKLSSTLPLPAFVGRLDKPLS